MSGFEAKMHPIRFSLGLRPRPRWGSLNLQRSPTRPMYLRGQLLLREGGKGRKEGGGGNLAHPKFWRPYDRPYVYRIVWWLGTIAQH